MLEINQIYCESCLDTMLCIEDNAIDLVITSPPYDDLRTYEHRAEWAFHPVAKELCRILQPGGVIVWIVGDATTDGSESGTSFKQALDFKALGLKLWDTMIYQKNGGAPAGSDNRYYNAFEYMFVLSKGTPKTINLIKDKPNINAGNTERQISRRRQDGSLKDDRDIITIVSDYGKRTNIWTYNTGYNHSSKDQCAFEHPAIFPEALVKDHIVSWSNPGDLIYDPFGGSGTTAKMAHLLGRRWILSEINPNYCEIARSRIEPYLKQQLLWGIT